MRSWRRAGCIRSPPLSAVIVYGVAAFLLWWAAFLMRRRRQILRAAAADLTCVDLDTGNVSKVTRADVDSDRTRALRPLLEKALRSGAAVTLPDDCPREVALKAKQDGSTLVFQILSAIDFETPLATATAVRSEAASQSAWWHLDALGDWAATDAELPARPPVPWCALYFPSMVIGGADPEDHPWLAVLAQQLTWCWDKHATVPRHYRTPRPGRSA